MKKYSYFLYSLSIAALIGCALLFNACGGEGGEEPNPKEENTKLITSGTWIISSVTVDDVNKNDLFTGFTLEFSSGGTYTTANGLPVWEPSGTWSFKDNTGLLISRDDGKEITIIKIDATELVFTMNWDRTTIGSGRIGSISGNHTFTFTK